MLEHLADHHDIPGCGHDLGNRTGCYVPTDDVVKPQNIPHIANSVGVDVDSQTPSARDTEPSMEPPSLTQFLLEKREVVDTADVDDSFAFDSVSQPRRSVYQRGSARPGQSKA
jgi:hypothetical protein